MLPGRSRLAGVSIVAALALALALPASSLADSEATTSPASSITLNSAVLNGVANPTNPDSSYFFQYGTTASYGQNTTPKAIGAGSQNVSDTISGLQPATTYHFQLVVQDGSYSPTFHSGGDMVFTTPAAGSVATTGSATSVTDTSAVLNGVVNTSNPDSVWAFQYGTSTSYDKFTTLQPVGAGVTAVSVKISGLQRNTVYHYRLVVAQNSYSPVYSAGADMTFTTAAHPVGTIKLRKRRLRIRHGRLSVPLRCAGARGDVCAGKLTVTVTKGKKTVRCIAANFSATAPNKFKITRKVRRRCRRLVKGAKHHKLGALLSLTTAQGSINRSVTLIG